MTWWLDWFPAFEMIRQAGKVDHSLRELVAQRVFSIACGYPDANDSARLSEDPIHKLLLDRDPIEGRDLASQPTLSRFENGVGVKELYRSGEFLAESVIGVTPSGCVIALYRVTIDLDPTNDPTHGAQQLSFFNGHYDTWVLPAGDGFCQLQRRSRTISLRRGVTAWQRDRSGGSGCHPAAFDKDDSSPYSGSTDSGTPGWRFRASCRAGVFGCPAQTRICGRDRQACAVEARRRKRNATSAPALAAQRKDRTYLWRSPLQGREVAGLRRVIIKAEVVRAADRDPKDISVVVTNMKQSPQWIYKRVYCQRGDIENRIKELHELEIDRTSCTSFWANQFRVLLTAAAYVLMQELRLRAAGTACARAQVGMLRERLLKLGARVLVSVRRVVVHLPASFPFLPAFRRVALALGAATG